MDDFSTAPRPTIITGVSYNGVNYVTGMEKALSESGLPMDDFKRLTEVGVLAGFEGWMAKMASGEKIEEEVVAEEITLPTVSDLAEFLEGYNDIDEIRSIQAQDHRKSAQEVYEARIAELEG